MMARVRELSKKLFCLGDVGRRGFVSSVKTPKFVPFAVFLYFGSISPSASFKMNALVWRTFRLRDKAISIVLGLVAWPKIRAAIVQPIPIDVVGHDAPLSAHYNSVKINEPLARPKLAALISAQIVGMPALMKMPLVAFNQFSVRIIEKSDTPADRYLSHAPFYPVLLFGARA